MTSIEKIRALIQDVPVHKQQTVLTDGTATRLQLEQFPVVESSVIITPTSAYSLSAQTGLLTFTVAPDYGDVVVDYDHVLLLDDTIQALIDVEDESADATADIRLAAADALDAIASSQTLIQKKIKLLDLSTDGPAVAADLRKHANTLRKMVFSADFDEATFDIAEQVYAPFGLPEKLYNDILKEL